MADPSAVRNHVVISQAELELLRQDAIRRGDEHSLNRLQMQREDDQYAKYRVAARMNYVEEGEIEIDDGAMVSANDEGGSYVLAWVYVYPEDVGIEGSDEGDVESEEEDPDSETPDPGDPASARYTDWNDWA